MYVAYFTDQPQGVFVEYETSPALAGSDPNEYQGLVSGGGLRWVNGVEQRSYTIQAKAANPYYVFDHWDLARYQPVVSGSAGSEIPVANRACISRSATMTVNTTAYHDVYTAVFIPRNQANGVFTEVSPAGSGTANGSVYYAGDDSLQETTLTAIPNAGYVWKYWEKANSGTGVYDVFSYENPITVPVKDQRDSYRAVFVTNWHITTQPEDPAKGTTTGDTDGYVNGQMVIQTTLQAFPKGNHFLFDHWEKTVGGTVVSCLYENPVTVPLLKEENAVYTAFFTERESMSGVYTQTAVDPVDGKTHGTVSGDMLWNQNGQIMTQTTITATPDEDYAFDSWEYWTGGEKAASYDTNPMTVKVSDQVDTYTAVFKLKSDVPGVTTDPDDASHGTTSGDTLFRREGQRIYQTTIQAYPATEEWFFDHWELYRDGSMTVTETSTANPYTVNVGETHDHYVAVFRMEEDMGGVYTEADDPLHGTTSGDQPHVRNGQKYYQTTIEAYPATEEWFFDHWELIRDGAATATVSVANPLSVKITTHNDVYVAIFRSEDNVRGVVTRPDHESHGTTSGDMPSRRDGQKYYETTIQAFPASNEWIFDHWERFTDNFGIGVTVSDANPLNVEVRSDHNDTYVACFRHRNATTNPDVDVIGHRTGIVSQSMRTGEHLFTVPVLSYDRSTLSARAQTAVNADRNRNDLPYSNAAAELAGLRKNLQAETEMTQDDIVELGREFVSSEGEVIPVRPRETDIPEKAHAIEVIKKKYGGIYTGEIVASAEVILPADFADGKRTILWSGLAVKQGERLLILQKNADGETQVTPIAEMDGMVRFSTNGFADSSFTLIRVTYN